MGINYVNPNANAGEGGDPGTPGQVTPQDLELIWNELSNRNKFVILNDVSDYDPNDPLPDGTLVVVAPPVL